MECSEGLDFIKLKMFNRQKSLNFFVLNITLNQNMHLQTIIEQKASLDVLSEP